MKRLCGINDSRGKHSRQASCRTLGEDPPTNLQATKASWASLNRPMLHNDFPPVVMEPDAPFDRIRELYLYEEPSLLASIHRGDRREATRIINLILVHIYSAGAERSELLKGLLLELIVMMSRAAVEAGASQSEVLGLRFVHLTELAGIEDDEQLARWLRESVVRIFDTVERHVDAILPSTVARALKIIREESAASLTRAGVARKAGVSPSHLAELLHDRTGRTFTRVCARGPHRTGLRVAAHHRAFHVRHCRRVRVLRPELFYAVSSTA